MNLFHCKNLTKDQICNTITDEYRWLWQWMPNRWRCKSLFLILTWVSLILLHLGFASLALLHSDQAQSYSKHLSIKWTPNIYVLCFSGHCVHILLSFTFPYTCRESVECSTRGLQKCKVLKPKKHKVFPGWILSPELKKYKSFSICSREIKTPGWAFLAVQPTAQ